MDKIKDMVLGILIFLLLLFLLYGAKILIGDTHIKRYKKKQSKILEGQLPLFTNCQELNCGDDEICSEGKCIHPSKDIYLHVGDDVFGGEKEHNMCLKRCAPGLKPCFGRGKGKNGYFCQKECLTKWIRPRCCTPNPIDYPCHEKCLKYCDIPEE